jgi:adenine-specific DNA-methyltransferase
MSAMTEYALTRQAEYLVGTDSAHRKQRGQVFTPPEIAEFMAELFDPVPPSFRLLDPGAGAGLLSVAFCERLLQCRKPHELHIEVFETEPQLVELLEDIFSECERHLKNAGHAFTYAVRQEDFIAAASPHVEEQHLLFMPVISREFDGVIMNPPYFKLRKDSDHARLMERVVHGQPNAYAFFLALAAALLKPHGQLVAITPRSFCNGLYFRGFRHWFFERMSLDRIHLFESRTEAFKDSGILQESVITKSHKLGDRSSRVLISGSFGKDIPRHLDIREVSHDVVVDNSCGENLVKIPVTESECEIMRLVEALPQRFNETGLRISTGPVVTFRATEYLFQEQNGDSAVPLLMPHNVKPFRTEWPITRKQHPTYIVDTEASRRRKLLIPLKNYVLLKRFSAKEEKRRLTASCLFRSQFKTTRIGLENHLNYVFHAERELNSDEVLGIAAVFNSSLVDGYFRILSGNTQVNATEIRNMHFPSLDTLARIGRKIAAGSEKTLLEIERIVFDALAAGRSLAECLVAEV